MPPLWKRTRTPQEFLWQRAPPPISACAGHRCSARYLIELNSDDRHTHLLVEGHAAKEIPAASVFASIKEASDFFARGALGYSVTAKPDQFDGLELQSFNWQVQPLAVDKVESSFFEDQELFPPGSVEFDCALLMRGIEHEWHGRGMLCGAPSHLAS